MYIKCSNKCLVNACKTSNNGRANKGKHSNTHRFNLKITQIQGKGHTFKLKVNVKLSNSRWRSQTQGKGHTVKFKMNINLSCSNGKKASENSIASAVHHQTNLYNFPKNSIMQGVKTSTNMIQKLYGQTG